MKRAILNILMQADKSVGDRDEIFEVQCPFNEDAEPETLLDFAHEQTQLFAQFLDQRVHYWYSHIPEVDPDDVDIWD